MTHGTSKLELTLAIVLNARALEKRLCHVPHKECMTRQVPSQNRIWLPHLLVLQAVLCKQAYICLWHSQLITLEATDALQQMR